MLLMYLTAVVGVLVGALFLFTRRKGKRCSSNTDLSGKTAIITGANTGIGFWTAHDFAVRKAKVILACRSKERGEAAREKIVAATGNKNVIVRQLDLFDFASVRKFAEQILQEEERLDILVNNAGVAGLHQQPSEHGLEVIMATNHFGPFLLTLLLIELLKKSTPSRIVNVSSLAHAGVKKGIDFDNLRDEKLITRFTKYGHSKLANVLFTRELACRLKETGVTAYCLHPGLVSTGIWRNVPRMIKPFWELVKLLFMQTAEAGAQTTIYVSVADEVKDESGKYYVECALAEDKVNPLANDREMARKLWEVSAELTGVSGDI